MPEPSAAELLHTGLVRYDKPADDEQDRKEGHTDVESSAVEYDVAVDASCVKVQGIGALDDAGDDGEQVENDEDIDGYESVVE